MNNYALTLIIKPDLDEKARQSILASVTKQMDKVEKEEMWGAKDLVYPIKHLNKGWYAHYLFTASPDKISPLDKALKINEDVIRYLIVRV
ncbi:MAG: 30S ribosomal protein S6 [Patescibacteria group bacterium]|nr:30S ribosomal protein S6 [Patescibacteria group bacterium]